MPTPFRVSTPRLEPRLKAAGVDGEDFATRLDARLETPLSGLTLTDNRSRILSVRGRTATEGGRQRSLFRRRRTAESPHAGPELRIHWGFALAPDEILAAVADFLEAPDGQARRPALAVLRAYFAEFRQLHEEGVSLRSSPRLRPVGEHHDLQAIRDEVRDRYFGEDLQVDITWGRRPPRRRGRRRSIHLGTYDERRNLIRIHRRLDHPRVPLLVVASVVHHEMLHAAFPAETVRGRRRLHPPEFRARERTFHGHAEAEAWIEANLSWLLGGPGPR